MLAALNDFYIEGVETSIPLYKTILNSDEYKNGDLSTDFLKRYDMIDRLTADLKKEKEEKSEAALAAAIIHSEYFKSRVQNNTGNNANWKYKLDWWKMNYKIQDIEKSFEGKIVENLGNNDYVIKINDNEHKLKIITMNSKGIEFILDQKYHKAKYLEQSTNEMNIVIDNVPIIINRNTHFDEVVYKMTGGASGVDAQLSLKSQIPGKVVSISVSEGDFVKKGDVVCTLESMKMQVAIKSHKDGVVKTIKVKETGTVAKGDVVAEIE